MCVRTARDAKAIQAHIRNCFEKASIPGLAVQESEFPKPQSCSDTFAYYKLLTLFQYETCYILSL